MHRSCQCGPVSLPLAGLASGSGGGLLWRCRVSWNEPDLFTSGKVMSWSSVFVDRSQPRRY